MPIIEIERPLSLFAPAKINLGLEILHRRPDGYHELATILQTISLFDRIDLLPAQELHYSPIPGTTLDQDLLWQALVTAERDLGITLKAVVQLKKGIPIASGLGGGSSDAGTLLGALGNLAGASLDDQLGAAARIGSDVPFFVWGGTALAQGTGTDLRRLPDIGRLWIVIAIPPLRIPHKTATLYEEIEPGDFSSGVWIHEHVERILTGHDISATDIPSSFRRALLSRPAVNEAMDILRGAGATFVTPSGAGPALFTLVPSFADARRVVARVRANRIDAYACTTVAGGLHLYTWR